jgi:hypothetical protein
MLIHFKLNKLSYFYPSAYRIKYTLKIIFTDKNYSVHVS